MPNRKILLVEDDPQVSSFICKGLTEAGFSVNAYADGQAGLVEAKTGKYNLVILDIMLPNVNGIVLCTELRRVDSQVPILFLTALGNTENVVLGLEAGADDYLPKPFKFIELLARVKTLLRRFEASAPEASSVQLLQFADVTLNDKMKSVYRADKEVSLTSTEYKLLMVLLKHPRQVLSRTSLLEQAWGVDYDLGTNVVDVYVNYLRKKLEVNNQSRLIHTVVGMGYVLKELDEGSK